MRPVGRRGFLGGVLGALAAASAPIGWVGRAFGAAATTPAEKVANLFSADAGAVRIGDAYLAAVPDAGDMNTLFDLLAPEGQEPDTWWAEVSMRELRRTIRAAAHADFAAGAVVDLEGWQLAQTEARLALLFARIRGASIA